MSSLSHYPSLPPTLASPSHSYLSLSHSHTCIAIACMDFSLLKTRSQREASGLRPIFQEPHSISPCHLHFITCSSFSISLFFIRMLLQITNYFIDNWFFYIKHPSLSNYNWSIIRPSFLFHFGRYSFRILYWHASGSILTSPSYFPKLCPLCGSPLLHWLTEWFFFGGSVAVNFPVTFSLGPLGSTETGHVDPELIDRYNSPGFVGCLSRVQFNGVAPLKYALRTPASSLAPPPGVAAAAAAAASQSEGRTVTRQPASYQGKLVESNCGASPLSIPPMSAATDPWHLDNTGGRDISGCRCQSYCLIDDRLNCQLMLLASFWRFVILQQYVIFICITWNVCIPRGPTVIDTVWVAHTFSDWLLVWYRMFYIEVTYDCVMEKRYTKPYLLCYIFYCGSLSCSNNWLGNWLGTHVDRKIHKNTNTYTNTNLFIVPQHTSMDFEVWTLRMFPFIKVLGSELGQSECWTGMWVDQSGWLIWTSWVLTPVFLLLCLRYR